MKCGIFMLLLSTLPAFAGAAEKRGLQLVPLKPLKVSNHYIGRVSATLIRSIDEEVLDTASTVVGDCESCARGIAVKGVLGMRFEGDSFNGIRVLKKSASGVHYHACKQPELSRSAPYECTFSYRDSVYTVKLQVEKRASKGRAGVSK